ncbi:MAG: VCBS repeat-containing protein [Planctomycetes bacterium]|nr:VCBS repeat-containing protein [Planctomycetota bacterium]
MLSKKVLIFVNILLTLLILLLVQSRLINHHYAINHKEIRSHPNQGKSYTASIQTFISQKIGSPPHSTIPPVVCNVQIVDIDKNNTQELIICDTQQHAVLIGSYHEDNWQETIIAKDIIAPARSHVCDFDNDGDNDIIIADLGDVFPNDRLVGQIILLRNNSGVFDKEIIARDIGRVADVRSGDFNSDGKIDLVVAVFGHGHGEVLLLTQKDQSDFHKTQLLQGPGAIHTPIADYNNDGHLDFACVLSQDEEEVWIFYNDGTGAFDKQLIFKTLNNDFGCSGLLACDIDKDGDQDLILPHGDNLEEFFHYPQAHHGCLLLENKGNKYFKSKKISDLPGCYAAATGDIDADGHIDIMLLSMVNDWNNPHAASVIYLKHDGLLNFTAQQVASEPIGLITCDVGDINNDGLMDMVAGSFRIHPPFNRVSRLHTWLGMKP